MPQKDQINKLKQTYMKIIELFFENNSEGKAQLQGV